MAAPVVSKIVPKATAFELRVHFSFALHVYGLIGGLGDDTRIPSNDQRVRVDYSVTTYTNHTHIRRRLAIVIPQFATLSLLIGGLPPNLDPPDLYLVTPHT